MAKRLFLAALLAASFACKGTDKGDDGGGEVRAPKGSAVVSTDPGRDAIENALMSLGLDGSVRRVDLNGVDWKGGKARIAKAHLLSEILVLEGSGAQPNAYAVRRSDLLPMWVSDLQEPTAFPISENQDDVFLVSDHFLHVLEKQTGRRTMQFLQGGLAGLRRPALRLPFTPTGGAAGQSDTVYVASLGSPDNNKTLESFSLVTGQRGWGYRTSGDIMTSPAVGGQSGDPKLYWVTTTGLVTCIDASNYGYAPRGPRWQELLEAGVDHELFLTPDGRGTVGAVFVVDREGMVYCLDRITGTRRWVNATGRVPMGGPKVFGDVCVVKMKNGLSGFDSDNVLYLLEATEGPAAGTTFWVRGGKPVTLGSDARADLSLADPAVKARHLSFEIQGEVLQMRAMSGAGVTVNGMAPDRTATLVDRSRIEIGNSVLVVRDRGSEALWHDLPYDRIVGRVGDELIAARGMTLTRIDARTGEALYDGVKISGARLIPANTRDGMIFVVGGEAVVYAFFPR